MCCCHFRNAKIRSDWMACSCRSLIMDMWLFCVHITRLFAHRLDVTPMFKNQKKSIFVGIRKQKAMFFFQIHIIFVWICPLIDVKYLSKWHTERSPFESEVYLDEITKFCQGFPSFSGYLSHVLLWFWPVNKIRRLFHKF